MLPDRRGSEYQEAGRLVSFVQSCPFLSHNPALRLKCRVCQRSDTSFAYRQKRCFDVVRLAGFEPTVFRVGVEHSIH